MKDDNDLICLDCGAIQTEKCGLCGKAACKECDHVSISLIDDGVEFCCDNCSIDPSCKGIPPTAFEVAQQIVEAIKSGEIEIIEDDEKEDDDGTTEETK